MYNIGNILHVSLCGSPMGIDSGGCALGVTYQKKVLELTEALPFALPTVHLYILQTHVQCTVHCTIGIWPFQ
jgi:hypothetical protein